MVANRSIIVAGSMALVLVLTTAAVAQQATAQNYDLAVYTPRLLFADNVARSLYAKKVATTLSSATGLTIHGRAFSRRSDLRNFMSTGRVDLVLADVGLVASNPRHYRVIASGTGPEGNSPTYAVLSSKEYKGIGALKGKRLGLPDATLNEVSMISNIAFEGEVDVNRFFGNIRWAHDIRELVGWLKTGRVDCTVGYASWGRKRGLKIVSTLRGVPLPVLAVIGNHIKGRDLAALQNGVAQHGLDLPAHGLLTRLAPARLDLLSEVSKMMALNAGERPAANAIWSPAQMEQLPIGSYGATAPKALDLGPINDRWRMPDYADL